MLEALTDTVTQFFGQYPYAAPFAVLLLCGIGLPLPEEVTLIGAGFLLYREEVEFLPISAVCVAAILLGDSAPYWLGRHYGLSALRVGWVRRILHPERFERMQRRFKEHGSLAVFACRFFAGVRIPGYFVAGTMRMSYARFLLLDLIGALLSVPTSIYLGALLGGQVERLHSTLEDFHLILAFLVITLGIVLVLRARSRKAAAEEAAAAAAESAGEGVDATAARAPIPEDPGRPD
jgi:membrane protein DedA with SNARE-associated domain